MSVVALTGLCKLGLHGIEYYHENSGFCALTNKEIVIIFKIELQHGLFPQKAKAYVGKVNSFPCIEDQSGFISEYGVLSGWHLSLSWVSS